jgi:hypothetical protein
MHPMFYFVMGTGIVLTGITIFLIIRKLYFDDIKPIPEIPISKTVYVINRPNKTPYMKVELQNNQVAFRFETASGYTILFAPEVIPQLIPILESVYQEYKNKQTKE